MMKSVTKIAFCVAMACTALAMADDESLAPGAGVILVRQAANVPKLSLLRRGVTLSPLQPDDKSKFIALLDPFIESQQKLIDDAASYHENSAKNQKAAEDGMRANGGKIREMIASVDNTQFSTGMKLAVFEASIFIENWPVGSQPDPLPALINASGANEQTAADIVKIRSDFSFHAKLALTDDRTLASIGAIDTQLKPKFWDAETLGVGIKSAAKARDLLTPQQREKWDAALESLTASKPG